jgi:hypothetical protein
MASHDRERDRDAASPRRFRCAHCKSELVRGKTHDCPTCVMCGVIIVQASPSAHRCEPWEPYDADQEQIAADIEQDVAAKQKHHARPIFAPGTR